MRRRDAETDSELKLPSIPDLIFPELIGVVVQVLVIALFLVAIVACGHKPPTRVDDPSVATDTRPRPAGDRSITPTATTGTTTAGADDLALTVDPVYFEYDSSELSERGRTELVKTASWLQRHPGSRLRVEGHTDDRGTTEYNLGLGDRRAHTIEDYLVRMGVERERLDTISYGEEQPAADGEDETAWAQNRRGILDVRH